MYLKEKGYLDDPRRRQRHARPVLGVTEMLTRARTRTSGSSSTSRSKETADVWPMIHIEDNNNTTYDFPNGDQPAQVDGKIVIVKINVEVR